MFKSALLSAVAILAAAAPAGAAITVSTTTSGTNPASDPGFGAQTLITGFEGALPVGASLTGDYLIAVAPGTPNVAAAPSGTPAGGHFLTVPNSQSSGTATFLLGGSYSAVSFYWGSIDDYNKLEVLGAGNAVLGTYFGNGLPAPTAANGDQAAPTSNRRVFFQSDAAPIVGFRFTSTNYAFETDTYAGIAAVPEPATWAMMIGGFGLVGGMARRRKPLGVTVTA